MMGLSERLGASELVERRTAEGVERMDAKQSQEESSHLREILVAEKAKTERYYGALETILKAIEVPSETTISDIRKVILDVLEKKEPPTN